MQVSYYDGQHRGWHLAAQFGEGALTDVSWTTPAAGHAPEYVAIAAGRTASVWKLEGSADQLQVHHQTVHDIPHAYVHATPAAIHGMPGAQRY